MGDSSLWAQWFRGAAWLPSCFSLSLDFLPENGFGPGPVFNLWLWGCDDTALG